MRTPTPAQARSHHGRQSAITSAAILAVRALFRSKRPLRDVAQTVAAYQYASATASSMTVARWSGANRPLTKAQAFAGVSSRGFPVLEPIIATIDRHIPAPVEPVPDPWWADWRQASETFMAEVEQLIASEIADAGRSASQTELVSHGWGAYVRVLTPPSCGRCSILAGRIYRWSDGFERHPQCDCQMVPVGDDSGRDHLLTDPRAAFDAGQIRGLSKADAQAIRDGADPAKVINATSGITTAGQPGRRLKATTSGTTPRSAWRRQNPTRLVRLRPEAIYRLASDQDDAVRLLKVYGYL